MASKSQTDSKQNERRKAKYGYKLICLGLKFLKMLFIITFFPSGGTGPALSFGCVCVRGMGCLHDTKGTLAWAQLSTFDCKLFVFFFLNHCMKTPSKQCFLSFLQANIY